MAKTFYIMVASILATATVGADSIRVGDTFYRDVYVRTSKDYYYVLLPDEGRTERVSRRRSDISEPFIDTNEAQRARLLAAYEAHKVNPVVPPKAPQSAPTTLPKIARLDGDIAKFRKQMKRMAEFESQLAHWKVLPEEIQQEIQDGLQITLAWRTEQRAANHEKAVEQIGVLGEKKATVEDRLTAADYARAEAVRRAQAENSEQYYLEAYDRSRVLVGPVYNYYYDHHDRLHAIPTYWYEQDPSLYDAARAERERTRRRIGAAEQAYAEEATSYGRELNSVERALAQRERDARATVSKAYDEQQRFGAYQQRVGALMEAAETGYTPRLIVNPLNTWSGTSNRRTETFSMGNGLWRIVCSLDDDALSDDFSVTIHNAETDAPYTRISGADYLGMRMRIFDAPGSYYLVIEQGLTVHPYTVKVSTLALR